RSNIKSRIKAAIYIQTSKATWIIGISTSTNNYLSIVLYCRCKHSVIESICDFKTSVEAYIYIQANSPVGKPPTNNYFPIILYRDTVNIIGVFCNIKGRVLSPI